MKINESFSILRSCHIDKIITPCWGISQHPLESSTDTELSRTHQCILANSLISMLRTMSSYSKSNDKIEFFKAE
jgi:hypothetical protein